MFRGRFSTTGLVGIDIGDRGVRLIQLSEQHGRLLVIGAARIDAGPIGDDNGGRAAHLLTEQLRSVISSGVFIGRRCVVSLPRNDIQIQAVRLPTMREEELAQAAAWEAAQRFSIERERLQCDYIRTSMLGSTQEGREEVLLVGAPTALITERLDPFVQAGFRPAAVDTGFSATARLFSRMCRREADRDNVRAILDVGYSGSIITILRGDQIAFSKAIDIGGSRFNEVVAEHLQIEHKAAAELRAARIAAASRASDPVEQSENGAFDPATDRAIYEAVRPVIGKLVKEVVLCVRYYGVTFRGHPPKTIILTGGDAPEPHLAEVVEHGCKVQTATDDEYGTLTSLLPQIESRLHRDPGPAACWSQAAGLSLRGLSRRGDRTDTKEVAA